MGMLDELIKLDVLNANEELNASTKDSKRCSKRHSYFSERFFKR